MSWRIIYIEEGSYLCTYLDNIKVSREGYPDIKVPLEDIHSIIIDNPKLTLTIQFINQCSEYNINVVTCGADHSPKTLLIPHQGHYASAKTLRNQLEWKTEEKEKLHQLIVKHKIRNQIQACAICNIDPEQINYRKLVSYVEQVQLNDKTNREGLAAKIYFGLMFGSEFYRFDDDAINSGLNYGYAILRSQISKVLIAKGLNTHLGIFHKGPENSFNLSDDVIEVFRPIIDVWVYDNLRFEDELTREHRKEILKLSTKKILIDGKKQTMINAVSIYVDSIVRYMENDGVLLFPQIDIYDL